MSHSLLGAGIRAHCKIAATACVMAASLVLLGAVAGRVDPSSGMLARRAAPVLKASATVQSATLAAIMR